MSSSLLSLFCLQESRSNKEKPAGKIQPMLVSLLLDGEIIIECVEGIKTLEKAMSTKNIFELLENVFMSKPMCKMVMYFLKLNVYKSRGFIFRLYYLL